MAGVAQRSMPARMTGAALLKNDVYEEVEHDDSATGQAAIVVGIVALAAAIGSWDAGIGLIIAVLVQAYLGWLTWSGVTYLIGSAFFTDTATWGELLRTLGFAQTPGLLAILAIIPVLSLFVGIVVFVWLLAAGIVAIRQALDVSTGKAIITAILGWLAYVVLALILAWIGLGPEVV